MKAKTQGFREQREKAHYQLLQYLSGRCRFDVLDHMLMGVDPVLSVSDSLEAAVESVSISGRRECYYSPRKQRYDKAKPNFRTD